jgi:WhiB family redox-sensing transcriptional regulator
LARSGARLREDPDLFFPVGNINSGPVAIRTDETKSVCRLCPVTEQRLAGAMDADPVEGISGGTTEAERRAMRRRTVRMPEATETAV